MHLKGIFVSLIRKSTCRLVIIFGSTHKFLVIALAKELSGLLRFFDLHLLKTSLVFIGKGFNISLEFQI